MQELVSVSLASPMVLCFILGIIATLVRSDLKYPDGMYMALTIYLLFAIGIKGGMKLSQTDWQDFLLPGGSALLLCAITPVWTFMVLHKLARIDTINAAALAAHFGSVSAVTFSQCIIYVESKQLEYEGFMPALLAIMEIPAIMIALFIAGRYNEQNKDSRKQVFHELLTGKGIILLLGGLCIGMLSGKKGFEMVAPFFDAPFKGVLCLFLLEVGLVTGRRLADVRNAGVTLLFFGLLIPVINGSLGSILAHTIGMTEGGAILFATLAASASYIAAPAAVRIALPEASPGIYLTTSLAIVFPFNVIVGIPLYSHIVSLLYH